MYIFQFRVLIMELLVSIDWFISSVDLMEWIILIPVEFLIRRPSNGKKLHRWMWRDVMLVLRYSMDWFMQW